MLKKRNQNINEIDVNLLAQCQKLSGCLHYFNTIVDSWNTDLNSAWMGMGIKIVIRWINYNTLSYPRCQCWQCPQMRRQYGIKNKAAITWQRESNVKLIAALVLILYRRPIWGHCRNVRPKIVSKNDLSIWVGTTFKPILTYSHNQGANVCLGNLSQIELNWVFGYHY